MPGVRQDEGTSSESGTSTCCARSSCGLDLSSLGLISSGPPTPSFSHRIKYVSAKNIVTAFEEQLAVSIKRQDPRAKSSSLRVILCHRKILFRREPSSVNALGATAALCRASCRVLCFVALFAREHRGVGPCCGVRQTKNAKTADPWQVRGGCCCLSSG